MVGEGGEQWWGYGSCLPLPTSAPHHRLPLPSALVMVVAMPQQCLPAFGPPVPPTSDPHHRLPLPTSSLWLPLVLFSIALPWLPLVLFAIALPWLPTIACHCPPASYGYPLFLCVAFLWFLMSPYVSYVILCGAMVGNAGAMVSNGGGHWWCNKGAMVDNGGGHWWSALVGQWQTMVGNGGGHWWGTLVGRWQDMVGNGGGHWWGHGRQCRRALEGTVEALVRQCCCRYCG